MKIFSWNYNDKFQKIFLAFLAIIDGVICGIIGSLFSKSISFVTDLRTNYNWFVFLLVFAGVLSVYIFKKFKTENESTTTVIKSIKDSEFVSYRLLPTVFLGSVLTHLCGGSAGREGAALQMGGATASFLNRVFKLDSKHHKILTVASMAGFFSALFGTPFGAAVFAIEVIRERKKSLIYLFPTIISSVTAFLVSLTLKIKPERFPLKNIIEPDFLLFVKLLAIIVLSAFLSFGFCKIMRFSKWLFKRCFKNAYLRVTVGAVLIIILTVMVKNNDYNGGGIHIIEKIFNENSVEFGAFLFKIIFTAITVSAGFKGGEIIPTFFIGATFGATVAYFIGISLPLGAAIGMVSLFCGVTKCPFASFVLSLEMFGIKGGIIFLVTSVLSFFLSGNDNLYGIKKFN